MLFYFEEATLFASQQEAVQCLSSQLMQVNFLSVVS